MVNLKGASGTRLVDTEKEVANVEQLIRRTVSPHDMGMIVSNIGVDPGFSAVYTSNSAMHTAFVQASRKPGHEIGSYEYIGRVKRRMQREMPELTAFFSSGSLVHERFVQEFRARPRPFRASAVFDPGSAVPLLYGSVHHLARPSARNFRVILTLVTTGTTLNVMSLMGVIMLAGHCHVKQHPHCRVRASSD